MKLSEHGEVILNVQDVFDGLYSGKITSLDRIFVEDHQDLKKFNESIRKNHERWADLKIFSEDGITQQEFDIKNQQEWFMPDKYKTLDIEEWLLDSCPEQHYERLAEELTLFRQHNFIDVLKYLKYLVDTMRKHNIVWGVGRGSSVASYCLYLIGVHKVDSIKYELDINEFLK